MLQVKCGSQYVLQANWNTNGLLLKQSVGKLLCCSTECMYFIHNGKLLYDDTVISSGIVHLIPRVVGGKGGFGSMLRAIGAQIEKTTNREACRDLSGRRLRDINEEKRLKTFINKQVEREKEALERKAKKLEKLCEMPKHKFVDEMYDKERSDLPEKVEDAVSKGLKVAESNKTGNKRKKLEQNITKKRPKLWLDADLTDECSTDSDSDSNEELNHNSNLLLEAKTDCEPSTSSSSN